MQLLKYFGPLAASAVFTVGIYASQIVTDKKELSTRIDNVQIAARSELNAAVQLRGVQVDALERRVASLEIMARENTAINMEILRKLTSLESASQYQSKTLDELKLQIKDVRK